MDKTLNSAVYMRFGNDSDSKKAVKLAIYMRVSLEELAKSESDSITNQRALIHGYIKNTPELADCFMKEYYDDGVSGTSFDRPRFDQMIQDLQSGKVNCVIVKDFSRFGRNYIETGEFLEQIFPFLGIRFISVNNRFDSFYDEYGLEQQFHTLTDDLYVKSLSENIKKTLRTKMINGTYIGGVALYGYRIQREKKKKAIVIDDDAAKIVTRTFELVSLGYRPTEIARMFNDENIPTPHIYKHMNSSYKLKSENCWRDDMISKIINDESYIGTGVFKKMERKSVLLPKSTINPKDEWIRVPNHHAAIVSEELFQKANHCLKYPEKPKDQGKKQRVFYAKIQCHCCGRNLIRGKGRNIKYFCSTPRYKYSPECVIPGIEEKLIEETLVKIIQEKANIVREKKKEKQLIKQRLQAKAIDFRGKIKQMEISLSNLKQAKFTAYERYQDDKITKEEFIRQKANIDQQIAEYERQIEEYNIALDESDTKDESIKQNLENFLLLNGNLTSLNRQIVDALVDKIIVYDSRKIEIKWKCHDFLYQDSQSLE